MGRHDQRYRPGLPGPRGEICTDWAASIVQQTITTDSYGHHRHDRVAVISGPHAGRLGYVVEIGWHFDDATETVHGPAGYVIDLDDIADTARIDADAVTGSSDLRWPNRTASSLKDGHTQDLHAPLPPAKTSAEDLADILARSADPAIVPESLRAKIAAAHAHHPVHHIVLSEDDLPELIARFTGG